VGASLVCFPHLSGLKTRPWSPAWHAEEAPDRSTFLRFNGSGWPILSPSEPIQPVALPFSPTGEKDSFPLFPVEPSFQHNPSPTPFLWSILTRSPPSLRLPSPHLFLGTMEELTLGEKISQLLTLPQRLTVYSSLIHDLRSHFRRMKEFLNQKERCFLKPWTMYFLVRVPVSDLNPAPIDDLFPVPYDFSDPLEVPTFKLPLPF